MRRGTTRRWRRSKRRGGTEMRLRDMYMGMEEAGEEEEGDTETRFWVMGYGLEASSMCIGISRHASRGPRECSFEAIGGRFGRIWGASTKALHRVRQRANTVDSREEQSRRGRRRGRRRRRRRRGRRKRRTRTSEDLVVDPERDFSRMAFGPSRQSRHRAWVVSQRPLECSLGSRGRSLGGLKWYRPSTTQGTSSVCLKWYRPHF